MIFTKFYNLLNGKTALSNIWDFLLFKRRTFPTESIEVPSDKVLIMPSPILTSELVVDGEVYIL